MTRQTAKCWPSAFSSHMDFPTVRATIRLCISEDTSRSLNRSDFSMWVQAVWIYLPILSWSASGPLDGSTAVWNPAFLRALKLLERLFYFEHSLSPSWSKVTVGYPSRILILKALGYGLISGSPSLMCQDWSTKHGGESLPTYMKSN